ncbi:hypothetical protein M673_23080 (plasmid) [Aureimonas sp. AU20]|uniref:Ti-type conjugative transfer relaxase TraA n=3 Tax=Aureimonas sp. AU20 TaxID=1349819 RepID=UPI00071F6DE5|nr:Ti-type conjugative transfer relaxase TraA [Aureimonas sp. AU20]ALN75629.1 hypothetical protein M673_23080 [Aureimonas sp. AU20]
MAIYSFRQSAISGGYGQSAVAAAAYRHSVRMERERGNQIEDYSHKKGTIHSEIVLPPNAPGWLLSALHVRTYDPDSAANRVEGPAAAVASEALWNAVETGEKRRDAHYATELVLALPVELTREQNIELVRAFIEQNYSAKGRVADWAYHLPEGREHNPHVHILSTVRPLTEQGFGPKATIAYNEDGEPRKTARGDVVYEKWSGTKPELYAMRASWAEEVNHALSIAGYDITVDHRSFMERGIHEIEPTLHRGKTHHMREITPEHEVPKFDQEDRAANFQAFCQNPSLVLEHITREQSTFDTRDIAKVLHRYAGRGNDIQGLMQQVGMLPELVTVQAQIHDPESDRIVQRERFTTTAVLEREALLQERIHSRHHDHSFAVAPEVREAAYLRSEEAQGFSYSPEQRAAIERLTRDEGVGVMVGIAGAGKSTVMRAVNEIYHSEETRVWGAALAGKAADNLQQSSGIASRTLASWESSWSRGFDHLNKGDVFVIDEAGMVASAQMLRVMERLDEFGAKVLLVGDARQLQPIEAGAAFRSIAHEVGYVELTEVRRQERDDHAQASVLFGAGQTRSALSIYHGNDAFQFHETASSAYQSAIEGWKHDWTAGADVVMLAHTNRDVLALNALAREAIRLDGGLSDGERFVTARGVREFAVGDRVLFLENDRHLGVRNGTIGVVEEIVEGRLGVSVPDRLEPVTVSREGYNNIDHGYATTIHKSQGATHDRVHVVASGMMDAQLSYVALSRHREEVTMHVPLDAFTHPSRSELATPDYALNRLAMDRLKDTSLDYAPTLDYTQARQALDERRAYEQSLAGRFDAFLEQRGLPHPSDVLQSVREFANQFFEQRRAIPAHEQIRVPTERAIPERDPSHQFEPGEDLRHALNRLEHVQSHSAAMNHEGLARRSAFFTAENELTRSVTAEPLRAYAETVAAIVPPSLVVSIGPHLPDAQDEPRLAHLSPPVLDALQANWRDVHAVSRGTWELGLLETVRAIDTSYRQEREDRSVLRDYERMVADQLKRHERVPEPVLEPSVPVAPRRDFLPAVTSWLLSVDQAVAQAVARDSDVLYFETLVRKTALHVWRDVESAWAQAKAEIVASPNNVMVTINRIEREPQSFGELLGGRTWLLRPDAERQAAIEHVPRLGSIVYEYAGSLARMEPIVREREIAWRHAMRQPLPALSREARSLLDDLNQAHSMRTSGKREQSQELSLKALENKPAWEELQSWSRDLSSRLTMPDAIHRIPGLSREDQATVQHTIEAVSVAERQADAAQKHERSRVWQIEQERIYGHERGHQWEW